MKTNRKINGQALVELTICLVAIVVLVSVTIQIISIARTRTDCMQEARKEAGRTAITSLGVLSDPEYIKDWEEGSDGVRYTDDDTFLGASSMLLSDNILGEIADTQEGWSALANVPDNKLLQLYNNPAPESYIGLVEGSSSATVDILPVVQDLVFGTDQIEVEVTVWMTMLGNYY